MTTKNEINNVYDLVGGPHDGGNVVEINNHIPQTIYLNGILNGNTFSTWSKRASCNFKYCYVLDGSKFKFERNKSYGK